MLSTLILTIIGPDRPGLVRALAEQVASNGGNWLESRLCRLGGEFAGIVRVRVPKESKGALLEQLSNLEKQGLTVVSHEERSAGAHKKGTIPQKLEIVGNDRPGIVRQVTGALAAQGANVEEFSSECEDAPMGGPALFRAYAEVLLPEGLTLNAIRAELEKIAPDLMVDIRQDT